MHRPGSDILDSFGQDKETIEAGSSSENRRTCQEAQLDILLAHQNFGICAHPASSISRGRMASPITTYPSQKHRGRLGRFHIRSEFNPSSASAKSVIFICDGYGLQSEVSACHKFLGLQMRMPTRSYVLLLIFPKNSRRSLAFGIISLSASSSNVPPLSKTPSARISGPEKLQLCSL